MLVWEDGVIFLAQGASPPAFSRQSIEYMPGNNKLDWNNYINTNPG